MGLATILGNLAALTVSGVTVYTLANTPVAPPPDKLPCLLFDMEGERTTAVAYDVGGSEQVITVEVQWLLVIAPIGYPLADSYVTAVAKLELVFAALVVDAYLSDSLVEPLVLPRIRFGLIERAGRMFYGVRLYLQLRYVP